MPRQLAAFAKLGFAFEDDECTPDSLLGNLFCMCYGLEVMKRLVACCCL